MAVREPKPFPYADALPSFGIVPDDDARLHPAFWHDLSARHAPDEAPVAPTELVLERLSEARKLEILRTDPRSRLIPTNHREKTDALTILAFLSDPVQHPGGIHDHLGEIFQKHKNDAWTQGRSLAAGAIKGALAVQSVLFEYADMFNSAESSWNNLGVLMDRINACDNPRVTLKEELDDNYDGDMTGVPELVRAWDTFEAPEAGSEHDAPPFDPFAVKIERFEKPVNGKNKIVHDVYTFEPRDPDVEERIQEVAAELPIGLLRHMVPEVRALEWNRGVFWSRVLRARYLEYQSKADNALATTSIQS